VARSGVACELPALVTSEPKIYPDSSSVDLSGKAGLDSHGNASLRDQVDHHYKRLLGFAALTSMFNAGFAMAQPQGQAPGHNGEPG
jgi:type IV secretory pathway VirB10-like protein